METPGPRGPDGANPLSSAAAGKTRVAVVHHWDADGIASAAMAVEEVRRASPGAEVVNRSPTIGRWRLDEGEIASLRAWGPELLVIVDLALQGEDLRALLDGLGAPAVMIDHHRVEPPADGRVVYHNPVANGGAEHESPSTSWVMRRLLGRPKDLLAILGVFGDRGRNAVDEPIWPELEGYLEDAGLTEDEMHMLVDLVDSSAKRNDVAGVDRAVSILLSGHLSPRSLLEVREWQEAEDEVRRVLLAQLEEGPERVSGEVLVKSIDTPYLVISTAARRLLRSTAHPVVLVANNGYSPEEVQIYVRSDGSLDLAPLIPELRSKGYSAGGKGEVVGVIVPNARASAEIERIIEYVARNTLDGGGY
jgi:single-stranded DNA-specific DHH superfamily exonuclease